MKRHILLVWALLTTCLVFSQNLALNFDGKYNSVSTGIGFIEAPWTLEAWIKGNDTSWKEQEAIFGGGWYSSFKWADNLPLTIKEGKLHCNKANLTGDKWMDDKWHHVALSCDGKQTSMLMDGKVIAKKDTAFWIVPGALGISDNDNMRYEGEMDEVRVWNEALTTQTINEWMNCPLSNTHPGFKNLIAYYNFDTEVKETSLNWVGSGYKSYHIRNGRVDYYGNSQPAYSVENKNEKFKQYTGAQRLFSAVSIESEWDADRGDKDNQVMKLRLTVQGKEEALKLEQMTLDLSEMDRLGDLSAIHVYATGKTARSTQRKLLFTSSPKRTIKINLKKEEQTALTEGANYILVTADVKDNARLGNKIRIKMKDFVLNGQNYKPSLKEPEVYKTINEAPTENANRFRVLQWNIWHGGNHIPFEGHQRIVDLIKASKADIVTMQEGYGTQHELAKALNFNLQTPSAKDNLCLYSRFPMKKLPTEKTFNSNPSILSLPNGKDILVNGCWLRYSYRPDYTGGYADSGHNTDGWVAEDSIRPMADAKLMLDNDTDPILKKREMPVIIGGDFNSGSHLDWTARAAHLHRGYGPVSFPTSRFMMERGYKDSFRELHPDEVAFPQGTFAGIYPQIDFSRIDFIYYKGNIKAISSKVIQTSQEIDDVWASDHSAVVTTFEFMK